MTDSYLDVPGDPVSLESLTVRKARQLAEFLHAEMHPWARLVDTLSGSGREDQNTVMFDVDVELSQERVYDIHPVERVAATFFPADEDWPETFALRKDFPAVPHRYITDTEFPRRLCLYEEPYVEEKTRWSVVSIVERIREWLRDTAAGTLHAEDQQLEQMLVGSRAVLILPFDIFSDDAANPTPLEIIHNSNPPCEDSFIAFRPPPAASQNRKVRFVVAAFVCPTAVPGAIRAVPTNLLELHQFCIASGFDLFENLRLRMSAWNDGAIFLDSNLVVVLGFPKARRAGSAVEGFEVWGFVTNDPVKKIGEALGLWQMRGLERGQLLGGTPSDQLLGMANLLPLNCVFNLSRAQASHINGTEPDSRNMMALGVGALGSQLVATLIRCGYGKWTFVDNDLLLPHNFARHELCHVAVGLPKANVMAMAANSILAEPSVDQAVIADVLSPGVAAEQLAAAFATADVIADFSASIEVSRHIGRDIDVKARRVAAFLNPRGSDLVVIAEDSAREFPLDSLEMQYYRELLVNEALERHLHPPEGRIRYARSCRDVSSRIPGDQVAMHAAIGSRALRRALYEADPRVDIWIGSEDLSSRHVSLRPSPVIECPVGDFQVITDQGFVDQIREFRRNKLPSETGGVLLGCWDLIRNLVYVVHSIASPIDSTERRTLYIRGSAGLKEAVDSAATRTAFMLRYVGEWHSHPDGFESEPSPDDMILWQWLNEKTRQDGFPPLMLIMGESGMTWCVGSAMKTVSNV
jgi:integrative and conjugative element protein (TIGR02256 family)